MKKFSSWKIALLATLPIIGLNFALPPSKADANGFANGCMPHSKYTLFQHANGQGKSYSQCGDLNISIQCFKINAFGRCVSTWNDSVSSISSPSAVTLYSDTNFQGNCITINTRRTVNLGDFGFDDVASSLRVGADRRCRVVK